ncbi:hypothetical protein [Castellaniella sp.]|uniref:hypothetical protein n=1 Tax=Castellaniella sp. TaxID=1955812 RepID=UPI002AFE041C|nr:hypothetical protein [Castellaniella sp.]
MGLLKNAANIEEAALAQLLGSLGIDDEALAQEVAGTQHPAAQRIAIKEVGGKSKKADRRIAQKPVRRHHANMVDRMRDTLADHFDDAMLLTVAERALNGEARKTKASENATMIRGLGKKAAHRATFLIEHAQGRTEKLNGVMRLALDTLTKDERLTTGKDGNLVAALVASGKTAATSRAMAGNTIIAMKALQIIRVAGDQAFIANPDSALLPLLAKQA